MFDTQLALLQAGDYKTLARLISLVENESKGYESLLQNLPANNKRIIGITGAPGAGKSTITDALIKQITDEGKTVGVLCVDPSSPFNLGALLGDRIRMSEWYTHPSVYIRSLGTRGSLGGLNPKIIEITDVMKAAGFDHIIVETVGVGQSEIEIAGLADVTVVVIVPEGGDEIQTMKAGIMEIADVFVVNKADREGADTFVNNLRKMYSPAFTNKKAEVPILKTVASQHIGIDALYAAVATGVDKAEENERKYDLLADKAYTLIQHGRMKDINKRKLKEEILKQQHDFNLYKFVAQLFQ